MNIRNKITGLFEIFRFDNWLPIILKSIFKPNSNLYLYIFKGKEYLLNKSGGDIPGFRTLLTSNEYKPFIKNLKLDESITLLDLGANVGVFPTLLSNFGFKIKKYVAVEYNTKTYYRLGVNITSNYDFDYRLLNMAVVGYARSVPASNTMGNTGENIFKENTKSESKQVMRGITLDELYNEFFDNSDIIQLMKIDIEGAEYEIFENENYNMIKNCKYLLMEIHNVVGKNKENIFAKLEAKQFENVEVKSNTNNKVYLFRNLNF